MSIGTILVTVGIFALMMVPIWRTFASRRGGHAIDGEAIGPPTQAQEHVKSADRRWRE